MMSKSYDVDTGLTLEDLNSQAYESLPIPPEEFNSWVDRKRDEFIDLFAKEKIPNRYYMLFGRGIGYFTVFDLKGKEDVMENRIDYNLIDCLQMIGSIYDILPKLLEDGSFMCECWVKPTNSDRVEYFSFFPYDLGIVSAWV